MLLLWKSISISFCFTQPYYTQTATQLSCYYSDLSQLFICIKIPLQTCISKHPFKQANISSSPLLQYFQYNFRGKGWGYDSSRHTGKCTAKQEKTIKIKMVNSLHLLPWRVFISFLLGNMLENFQAKQYLRRCQKARAKSTVATKAYSSKYLFSRLGCPKADLR